MRNHLAKPHRTRDTGAMILRDETPDDAAAIRALTTLAFRDAPHASGTEAAIVDALRAAGALTLSLVATEGGAVVGHVAFSPLVIDSAPQGWFGLGPISVHPGHQGRGIGRALIEAGLARLRAAGAAGCALLGDPALYARCGFRNDPALSYGDVPPPWFQRLVFHGPAPKGQARFHPAFDVSR